MDEHFAAEDDGGGGAVAGPAGEGSYNCDRTKRVAKNKPILEKHWARERQESWDAALGMLRDVVKLACPKRGWKVLTFPDMSDLFWGSVLTQVSPPDFASKNTMGEWHHEPLEVLGGIFKGSQLRRWPTMDREGFAIMSTFQRLEYLLWGGVNIVSPGALVAELSKATVQRLSHFRTCLEQFDYQIVHIPGSENV